MIIDLKAKLLQQATARIEAGDLEAAVPILEQVTRFARGDDAAVKFAHVNLAAHFYEIGDPRAVRHFQAALAIDPDDDRVRYCLGHAHLDGEEWDAAAEAFATALEMRPDDAEYLRSLGLAHAEAGRPRESLVYFERAARLAPEEAIVRKDLAQALAACGRHSEAIRHARRAVALAPDEPIYVEVLEELQHLSEAERLARPRRTR